MAHQQFQVAVARLLRDPAFRRDWEARAAEWGLTGEERARLRAMQGDPLVERFARKMLVKRTGILAERCPVTIAAIGPAQFETACFRYDQRAFSMPLREYVAGAFEFLRDDLECQRLFGEPVPPFVVDCVTYDELTELMVSPPTPLEDLRPDRPIPDLASPTSAALIPHWKAKARGACFNSDVRPLVRRPRKPLPDASPPPPLAPQPFSIARRPLYLFFYQTGPDGQHEVSEFPLSVAPLIESIDGRRTLQHLLASVTAHVDAATAASVLSRLMSVGILASVRRETV